MRPAIRLKGTSLVLYASAFLIATAGLVYELIAGTIASYMVGDSVTQFSHTIGIYLFAMGAGSWMSGFIRHRVAEVFVELEIAIAVVGGSFATLAFLMFAASRHSLPVLYALLFVTGVLVGTEIPLLLRLVKHQLSLAAVVARVLALDYLGGLIAALVFPILIAQPGLGLQRTSLAFGFLNLSVAFAGIYVFRHQIRTRRMIFMAVSGGAVLAGCLIFSRNLEQIADSQLYADPVIYARQTPYQRIVLTKSGNQLSLFLNENLQFNSWDEYRYHEILVRPALETALLRRSQVTALVLGGGDGLAVRELLAYPQVTNVTLVDLDPAMTGLAGKHPVMSAINQHAFDSPRVKIVHDDAYVWLRERKAQRTFDLVVIDFPDPVSFATGKLYTASFYRELRSVVHKGSQLVTQATSPLIANAAYSCIAATIRSAGYRVCPLHTYVPSFGEWGFIQFSLTESCRHPGTVLRSGRFWDDSTARAIYEFSPDMAVNEDAPVHHLENQILVSLYGREWGQIPGVR